MSHISVSILCCFRGPIFIKGLVNSTHVLQRIFSSWNKEKLCSPIKNYLEMQPQLKKELKYKDMEAWCENL